MPNDFMSQATVEELAKNDKIFEGGQARAAGGRCDTWRGGLHQSSNGAVMCNLRNTVFALHHAPELADVFRWNEFESEVYVTARPPWTKADETHTPHKLRDNDITLCQLWLYENAGMDVRADGVVMKAIVAEAETNRYHPIRAYLDSLTWDGEKRLDGWLIKHLGAADTKLNKAIGRKWMTAGVARVKHPGEKFDHMLIIEGFQDLAKSGALRTIAGGEEFFTDNLPDLEKKDCMEHLQGKWIIEIAELDTMHRAETNRLKAFLSRQNDRYRPSFGKLAIDHLRQSIFAGTTNRETEYLKDATGSRRFWCVEIKNQKIDIAALAAVRDQLWAEAVVSYEQGEKLWLDDAALAKEAEEIADERFEADPWTDKVLTFLECRETVTTAEILGVGVLGKEVGHWTRADEMRVAKILRHALWMKPSRNKGKVKAQGDGKKTRTREYLRPSSWGKVEPVGPVDLHKLTIPPAASVVGCEQPAQPDQPSDRFDVEVSHKIVP